MYGTIRRYKLSKPKEFIDKVNSSFINVIRKVPGFISYIGIDEGDGRRGEVSRSSRARGLITSCRTC
jgi:S-adenosylmethionine synthetase